MRTKLSESKETDYSLESLCVKHPGFENGLLCSPVTTQPKKYCPPLISSSHNHMRGAASLENKCRWLEGRFSLDLSLYHPQSNRCVDRCHGQMGSRGSSQCNLLQLLRSHDHRQVGQICLKHQETTIAARNIENMWGAGNLGRYVHKQVAGVEQYPRENITLVGCFAANTTIRYCHHWELIQYLPKEGT